ncbi:DNA-binding transcriptional regulator, MarR family [Draconibacterium orientale]|jgi:DNA-binding MarR family transcriptional regulator|uniref:DNA-binding transcriptional regulator, MarR family n=1 Tax=Draconibacterium orientale TaxID=1168034 RepID=X5DD08_9BACT|nr:MarR family transcriptional regulator [Draconibacterium orientale]AHW60733.1 MarR family transcriptional regulator [Draconibacterium orientale]SEU02008.1 DNA-binding transcriptional regulator, MarR family [Draconibacterium orientale]
MEEKLKLKSQVCFPVYALSREIVNVYRPILEEIDLTYPQYLVMMVLWENEPQKVHEIGNKLNLDNGTLTPLLKRLSAKGLISRKRNSKDERVVEISLTESGKQLQTKAAEVPQKVVKAMGITHEDLMQLKELVVKILNRAK